MKPVIDLAPLGRSRRALDEDIYNTPAELKYTISIINFTYFQIFYALAIHLW